DKKEKTRGGRKEGSRNFSAEEIVELVNIVGRHVPIGSNGWDAVVKEYNIWAEGKYVERDSRSLKAKFDSVHSILFFRAK
ncbi:hypothetical protein BYT27DRAFT_7028741, partial [Phlegmacium glaucopus]